MAAWRKILIVLVALTAVVAAAASGSESDGGGDSKGSDTTAAAGDTTASDAGTKSSGEASEVDDVKVNTCGKDDTLGFAQANITVTNNSSKASNYMIEITFTSKDGKTQIGTGNSFIQNLAPGQNKTEDVSSLDDAGDAEIVCTVSSVDRTESL
ncbi:MAG: hypothetical protein KDA94_16855 [Acidimicrobiales bacterium]|nr:hypothetical protein [Acidimicrobiales bacterium]